MITTDVIGKGYLISKFAFLHTPICLFVGSDASFIRRYCISLLYYWSVFGRGFIIMTWIFYLISLNFFYILTSFLSQYSGISWCLLFLVRQSTIRAHQILRRIGETDMFCLVSDDLSGDGYEVRFSYEKLGYNVRRGILDGSRWHASHKRTV